MKKILFALIILGFSSSVSAQTDEHISTLQFVQIVDGHLEETLYYFEHNWKELRDQAIEIGIIESYEFIRTEPTDDYPINLVLLTTYKSEEQFKKREKNFERIMEGRELNLLNDLQPNEFRKTVFVKERSTHSFKK